MKKIMLQVLRELTNWVRRSCEPNFTIEEAHYKFYSGLPYYTIEKNTLYTKYNCTINGFKSLKNSYIIYPLVPWNHTAYLSSFSSIAQYYEHLTLCLKSFFILWRSSAKKPDIKSVKSAKPKAFVLNLNSIIHPNSSSECPFSSRTMSLLHTGKSIGSLITSSQKISVTR